MPFRDRIMNGTGGGDTSEQTVDTTDTDADFDDFDLDEASDDILGDNVQEDDELGSTSASADDDWEQPGTDDRSIMELADDTVGATTGAIFDNPVFSVQDSTQTAMESSYQLGQRAGGGEGEGDIEDVGESFSEARDDVRSGLSDSVEDTPLDNPITDGVAWAADALVANPAESAFGTVTGVDVEDGDTDFRPSAMEAGELALIGGTAGTGSALRGASSGSGRLSGILGRSSDDAGEAAARSADDAAGAAGRSADDAGSGVERVDAEALGTTNLTGSTSTSRFDDIIDVGARSADDAGDIAARSVDDAAETAARAADDAGEAGARASDNIIDVASRTVDDAAEAAGRQADDLPTLAGRSADDAAGEAGARASDNIIDVASRTVDDAAEAAGRQADDLPTLAGRSADDAAGAAGRTADDGASIGARISDTLGSLRPDGLGRATLGINPRTAALGTGGLLGAGAAGTLAYDAISSDDMPDEFEATIADENYSFQLYDTLEPTEDHPNGAGLYQVQQDFSAVGYWVLLGLRDQDVILLDADGDTRTAAIDAETFELMLPEGSDPEDDQ